MRAFGFGTERLEQELEEIFPHARVGKLDRDSTRRKGEIYKILKSFSRNEIDILVGTQMLTKGYDFPNVTLVGVISADISLGFPDFWTCTWFTPFASANEAPHRLRWGASFFLKSWNETTLTRYSDST
jgi:primosomal protein N'